MNMISPDDLLRDYRDSLGFLARGALTYCESIEAEGESAKIQLSKSWLWVTNAKRVKAEVAHALCAHLDLSSIEIEYK